MAGDAVGSEQAADCGHSAAHRHGKRQGRNLGMKPRFPASAGDVHMRVDKAGRGHAAARVHFHGGTRPVGKFRMWTYRGDFVVDDHNVRPAQRLGRIHDGVADNGGVHGRSFSAFATVSRGSECLTRRALPGVVSGSFRAAGPPRAPAKQSPSRGGMTGALRRDGVAMSVLRRFRAAWRSPRAFPPA